MTRLLMTVLLLCAAGLHAQSPKDGITFAVEELKRPGNRLAEISGQHVADTIAPEALVSSIPTNSQVYMGAHPFFNGMYKAYAEHRPFELSPDMIWLLICQGFAHHVNNNAEELRSLFVNFEGKKSLVVKIPDDQRIDRLSTWEAVIPQFLEKASEDTGKELFDDLTPAYSTTGSVERIATQITALESTKAYFEYVVLMMGCGIPEITLRGTPDDWKLLASKAQKLRRYKLDWWIDELDPLLQEFIKASEGKISRAFWRKMFKYHTRKVYGAPKVIDGWIVKFFPYNANRKRNNLESIRDPEALPDERVAVDFKFIKVYTSGRTETMPMQFVAGFTGLLQDKATLRLIPQIGWLVTPPLKNRQAGQLEKDKEFGLCIRVSEVPVELLQLDTVWYLTIEFIDSVSIPDQLASVGIDHMQITGKVSPQEMERITALFPDTDLVINRERQRNRRYEAIAAERKQERDEWEQQKQQKE